MFTIYCARAETARNSKQTTYYWRDACYVSTVYTVKICRAHELQVQSENY